VRGELHIVAALHSGKETHWREDWIDPTTRLDMMTTRKMHISCHELNACDHPIAGHQLTVILETQKSDAHSKLSLLEPPPILRCRKLQTVTGIQCAML
jgi:hypothetical protein